MTKITSPDRREAMMILFHASNLAEVVGVPEFFADEIGKMELIGPNVRFMLCATTHQAGQQLLIPKCEIIRPLCTLAAAIEQVQNALTTGVNSAASFYGLPTRAH